MAVYENIAALPKERVPRHVAIILDGNGRWAAAHSVTRSQGHLAGADNLEKMVDVCIDMGISYLTVYAFSTENWKRSAEEVSYLMSLMKRYLIKNKKDAIARRTRIRVIGDKAGLAPELQTLIADVENDTKSLDRFHLTFAINYGGRDEICRVAQRIVDAGETTVTPEVLSAYLDTADLPDPDLLIRTSGEQRISNFLLWQIAYSELWFTEKYWPDFSAEDLEAAVLDYAKRERRFGGRKEKQC